VAEPADEEHEPDHWQEYKDDLAMGRIYPDGTPAKQLLLAAEENRRLHAVIDNARAALDGLAPDAQTEPNRRSAGSSHG
jgi:hypothetical protein